MRQRHRLERLEGTTYDAKDVEVSFARLRAEEQELMERILAALSQDGELEQALCLGSFRLGVAQHGDYGVCNGPHDVAGRARKRALNRLEMNLKSPRNLDLATRCSLPFLLFPCFGQILGDLERGTTDCSRFCSRSRFASVLGTHPRSRLTLPQL